MNARIASLFLLTAAFALQGCVAAVLPLAAAGVIGKKQVDAMERTRNAEAQVEKAHTEHPMPKPIVTVGPPLPDQAQPVSTAPTSAPVVKLSEVDAADVLADQPVIDVPVQAKPPVPMTSVPLSVVASGTNPYLPFAQYALAQSEARASGKAPRGAVLVEAVSLTEPKMVSCGDKPMAVIIDIDPANSGNPPQTVPAGLSTILETLRGAGIRIAWIGDDNATALREKLAAAKADTVPIASDGDLYLSLLKDQRRKQERRWELARDFCVIAVAGDTKADFDELYDYLRVPEYAIGLDIFWDRGWFMAPSPLAIQVEGGQVEGGQ